MFRWVLYCAKDRQNNNEPLHPGWDGGFVGASDQTRLHFALQNYSSHQFLNWWQQHATGMLRYRSSSQSTVNKTISIPVGMEIVLELVT